ncbi:hypothetical protein SAMN05216489_06687 [Streptomyces sp. 3213]|uniref:hypothetical protein n=1 Tax=Streptomyces sp. 3213.3 TaxID=1855348 RepID=UPI0008967D84|nr:hypothetical protein [Streptomyces sp. 3213.3]SEE45679.1 hypothetical protein SAMN05216489_06687 [Streptomyces sp. 3213] [Streptomyces sp. 3213.3]
MRRSILAPSLAVATLALALTGCGGTKSDTGSGSVSPSSSPTPSKSKSACASKETLAATDDNGTFCLTTGNTIRILLDGTESRPWAQVKTAGTGLEATNSGILIRPGDASNAFKAVSAGTVRLTSSRPLCATAPHKISCKGIQEWSVTVVVTKS